MTLLVRDEESILPANIEYHLSRGVDFIIATDNRSEDSTREILADYERSGKVRCIHEPGDDYSQDIWVTRMAGLATEEYDADWIIHTDADEFWWPEHHHDLKDLLRKTPDAVDGLRVQRSNFIAPQERLVPSRFYEAMQYRQSTSTNPLGGPLPPKVCHRGLPGVYVHQGNHSFELESRKAVIDDSSDLVIWHFPFRGFGEFRRKIRQGGPAYERNTRLPKSLGHAWRRLWQLEQAGELQEYYDAQTKASTEIEEMVRRGEAVHDPRFAQYMAHVMEEAGAAGRDASS